MKLQECYEKLEGDYVGVLSRLMREASVSRFLIMFLKDNELENFHTALDANDYATAFRAVHTLKGACLNLGISKLANAAITVTETLRGGEPTCDMTQMILDLDAEYKRTKEIISEYSEAPEF